MKACLQPFYLNNEHKHIYKPFLISSTNIQYNMNRSANYSASMPQTNFRRNMGVNFSNNEIFARPVYARPGYAPPRQNILSTQSISKTGNKGQVIAFQSSAKWKVYFEATKQTSKLIVIDFTASWCKPCKIIQPAFDEFAERYTDVEFIKIDVDQLPDVAAGFGVHVMPTFLLMKRGREVDKVVGVKKDELQKKIEKHRF